MAKESKKTVNKKKNPGCLLFFYGRECPHCIRMEPVVEKLEKEEKLKFKWLEVWHDEDNAAHMDEFSEQIVKACGGYGMGVPAFMNSKTNEALCGEVDYDTLKKWATKK